VAAAEPLYVLERRAPANEVVVGPARALETREVRLRGVVDRGLGEVRELRVQLRYRSPSVPVAALSREGGGALVQLGKAFSGLAPGQSAVFYRDGVVVGGGVVSAPGSGQG
jgi:tRNA-specific 2-thiouridylase